MKTMQIIISAMLAMAMFFAGTPAAALGAALADTDENEGDGTSESNIVITEKGSVQGNSDNTVVITISHASAYLLKETPLLDSMADIAAEDETVAAPEAPPEATVLEPMTGADVPVTAPEEPTGGNGFGWIIGVVAALSLVGGSLAIFLYAAWPPNKKLTF